MHCFVFAETNMVRVPGCYDVHWYEWSDWLWDYWRMNDNNENGRRP